MKKMRKTQQEREAIINAYKTSGQRQIEWCRNNNVNINNLRYWLQKEQKKRNQEKASCQWLVLNNGILEPTPNNECLTLQIGPVMIRVGPETNQKLLTDVVKAVIAAC